MPRNRIATRHVTRGFTLVELLVVMSIIVLLLTILLPSMQKAREVARRAVCGSNLHQLSVSFLGYAGDNFTVLPWEVRSYGGNDGDNFNPYTFRGDMFRELGFDYDEPGVAERIWMCPSNPKFSLDPNTAKGSMYGWRAGKPWTNSKDQPNVSSSYYYLANAHREIFNGSYMPDDSYDRLPQGLNAPSGVSASQQVLISDKVYYSGYLSRRWLINHEGESLTEGNRATTAGASQGYLDGSVTWSTGFPAELIGGKPGDYASTNAGALHVYDAKWSHVWW